MCCQRASSSARCTCTSSQSSCTWLGGIGEQHSVAGSDLVNVALGMSQVPARETKRVLFFGKRSPFQHAAEKMSATRGR